MSRVEFAAILRAKAWRNYSGVFTAPGTRQERAEQPDGLGLMFLANSTACQFSPLQANLELFDRCPRGSETIETRMACR